MSPMSYQAHIRAWKQKLKRAGFTFDDAETRRANQLVLANVLRSL